jgi:ribose transport system ATP-binding protein
MELRSITRRYSGVLALDDVSLKFMPGSVHALVGANGAGKSTLVKIVSGALEPSSGEIAIGGREYSRMTPRSAFAAGVRTIYQEFTLVTQLPVMDNIFLGREVSRVGVLQRQKQRATARELLESLGASIDPRRLVGHLNVAEQQQVEIAKALIGDMDGGVGGPRLLLMDEPTSGLTAREAQSLFDVIRRLKRRGACVVFISHRLDEIIAVADQVSVLQNGRLVATKDVANITRESLARLIVGKSIQVIHGRRPESPAGVDQMSVLRVADVSNPYLKHISFEVAEGEILGVFGLVGSGRTRLARALFGLDRIREGDIWLGQRRLDLSSPHSAIRTGIGMVPEDRNRSALVPAMSVRENATLASLRKFRRRYGTVSRRGEARAVDTVTEQLRVRGPSSSSPIKYLSGGNQQKICVARWMLADSSVLIFDEPTRGVDIAAKAEIYEQIRHLADAGHAIIVLSSETDEIVQLTERVLVMHDGWIRQELKIRPGDEHALLLATGTDVRLS